VVENLHRHREVGVCGEVRGTNHLKLFQSGNIHIRGFPHPFKLVVVHKEMQTVNLRFITGLCKIEADPVFYILAVKGDYFGNPVVTHALKKGLVEIFIVPCLPIHCRHRHAVLLPCIGKLT